MPNKKRSASIIYKLLQWKYFLHKNISCSLMVPYSDHKISRIHYLLNIKTMKNDINQASREGTLCCSDTCCSQESVQLPSHLRHAVTSQTTQPSFLPYNKWEPTDTWKNLTLPARLIQSAVSPGVEDFCASRTQRTNRVQKTEVKHGSAFAPWALTKVTCLIKLLKLKVILICRNNTLWQ